MNQRRMARLGGPHMSKSTNPVNHAYVIAILAVLPLAAGAPGDIEIGPPGSAAVSIDALDKAAAAQAITPQADTIFLFYQMEGYPRPCQGNLVVKFYLVNPYTQETLDVTNDVKHNAAAQPGFPWTPAVSAFMKGIAAGGVTGKAGDGAFFVDMTCTFPPPGWSVTGGADFVASKA